MHRRLIEDIIRRVRMEGACFSGTITGIVMQGVLICA